MKKEKIKLYGGGGGTCPSYINSPCPCGLWLSATDNDPQLYHFRCEKCGLEVVVKK